MVKKNKTSKVINLCEEANGLIKSFGWEGLFLYSNPIDLAGGAYIPFEQSHRRKLMETMLPLMTNGKRKELEKLLEKATHGLKLIKNGKLKFKIDSVEDVEDNDDYKFQIYLVDNMKGNSSLFIPTVSDAIKRGGRNKDGWIGSGKEGRQIVHNFWEDNHYDLRIELYSPNAYIKRKGISMYVNRTEDVKEYASGFITDMGEIFVKNKMLPIVFKIEDLFKEGSNLLHEREVAKKDKKNERKVRNLVGKEF